MRIVCCDPFTWNIVSYLTAWPSRDLIRAAHQQITRDWWAFKRSEFALYISQAVLDEAGAGDAKAAADRMNILKGIPILDLSPGVEQRTEKLKREIPLPGRAEVDAIHIACAAVHGMEFLLTWNCRHIANAVWRPQIERACRSSGLEPPIICTPDELMEND